MLSGRTAINRAVYDKYNCWHKHLFPKEEPNKYLQDKLNNPEDWKKIAKGEVGREFMAVAKNGKPYKFTHIPLPILALKQILIHELSLKNPLLWRVRLGKVKIPTCYQSLTSNPTAETLTLGDKLSQLELKLWTQQQQKNHKYIMLFDIKSFYANIHNELLEQKICAARPDLMELARLCINLQVITLNGEKKTITGLPIGNPTELVMANLYLEGIDSLLQHLDQTCRASDDMKIFSNNDNVDEIKHQLSHFLGKLQLQLNPSKCMKIRSPLL